VKIKLFSANGSKELTELEVDAQVEIIVWPGKQSDKPAETYGARFFIRDRELGTVDGQPTVYIPGFREATIVAHVNPTKGRLPNA
jgi:hypothetical protein